MRTGKTASGFEFALAEEALNDMELLDALTEVNEQNPLGISKACRILLGDEQRRRLYDHIRGDNGRVAIDAVTNELLDIIRSAGNQGKN